MGFITPYNTILKVFWERPYKQEVISKKKRHAYIEPLGALRTQALYPPDGKLVESIKYGCRNSCKISLN